MIADAIDTQNSSSIPPTGYVDPLPQTGAPIPPDYVTPPLANSSLRPPEKEPPACSPKGALTIAGLCGIAGGGLVFGMIASCTILGGAAGVILGCAASGAAHFLLKLAIVMLIAALKEPNNSSYAAKDFANKMKANFEKYHPVLVKIHELTTITLIIAPVISLIALGGTQGIILSLVLTTTACSLDFLLNYLSYYYPQFFYYQEQSS